MKLFHLDPVGMVKLVRKNSDGTALVQMTTAAAQFTCPCKALVSLGKKPNRYSKPTDQLEQWKHEADYKGKTFIRREWFTQTQIDALRRLVALAYIRWMLFGPQTAFTERPGPEAEVS